MIKKLSKGLMAGVLFMCFPVSTSYADEVRKTIALAIFPCTDVVMSFKKFHPLASYLKKETGYDINLVFPKDNAEFERNVKNREIDFVFQDPHMYVSFARFYDKSNILRALTRKGATGQSGVVIARKDGGITKMEDLIGKTVMFGPKFSAAKWVAARWLFEENGINIDNDLRAYSNGGCCEDIAFSVYLKAVDAGVVCDHFLEEHIEKQQELGLEAQQIVVICRTKSVPTKIFAAREDLRNDVISKVNQALLRLDNNKPDHKKILYRAELGGFQKSKDESYDGIRIMIGAKNVD